MDGRDKAYIEHQCIDLVNRFAVYNDAMRYGELADLFSESAKFARPTDPDNYINGRDSILKSFQSRPQNRIIRHIISNVVIDVVDQSHARGVCYALQYTGDEKDLSEAFGIRARDRQFVGEFHDLFELTDSGWKFSQRSGKIIFTV